MKQRYKKYSMAEEERLRELYGKYTYKEIGKIMNRSAYSVGAKMSNMLLPYYAYMKPLEDKEEHE